MKKNLSAFLLVLYLGFLLSACTRAAETTAEVSLETTAPVRASVTNAPSETPYPTQTPYLTQTPYPTFTPLPVTPTRIADISAAMVLPEESLSWYLTYADPFTFDSIRNGAEVQSYLSSATGDGSVAMRNRISCKDEPYSVSEIPIRPDLIPYENDQQFGEYSVTYKSIQPKNSFFIYFLQGNCLIEVYVQQPNFSGGLDVNEIAGLIEERLRLNPPEAGLTFPSYEVDPAAAQEYFFSVEAGKLFIQDWQNYYYMARLDIRKPFIQKLTLGIYDLDGEQFIGKKEYIGNIKIGENLYQVNDLITPRMGDHFQLWVWADGKLVSVVEMPYN